MAVFDCIELKSLSVLGRVEGALSKLDIAYLVGRSGVNIDFIKRVFIVHVVVNVLLQLCILALGEGSSAVQALVLSTLRSYFLLAMGLACVLVSVVAGALDWR